MGEETDEGGLSQWLRERCQKEGLSLREAGQKSDLSHSTIRDIVNGSAPTPETIRKLARAFNGGHQHTMEALEDRLLVLAGHRTERGEKGISEPVARLLDIVSDFSESQMKVMTRFADFLADTETGK